MVASTCFIFVMFLVILVCVMGVKGRYAEDAQPPHNLWICGSATPNSHFGNVYYYCNAACIFAMWPSFVPSSVVIPPPYTCLV